MGNVYVKGEGRQRQSNLRTLARGLSVESMNGVLKLHG